MKSVGEVLALGRSFAEAFGKAMSARELDVRSAPPPDLPSALRRLRHPSWDRCDLMLWASAQGVDGGRCRATGVDPWFCAELTGLAAAGRAAARPLESLDADRPARRATGRPDRSRPRASDPGADERAVGRRRRSLGVSPTYHAVDTCAAEFAAQTPYFYRRSRPRVRPLRDDRPPLVVLGSGPNRIGQGIEFDYCCVHAAEPRASWGTPAVMINCNPETVSTDHGVSDRLYLEPVTLDAVLDICALERPAGVITQLGGQTPLRLAADLDRRGRARSWEPPPDAIDLAEDRERFGEILDELGLLSPRGRRRRPGGGRPAAARSGYPAPGAPLVRAGRPGHGGLFSRGPNWPRISRPNPSRAPGRCW